MVVHEPQKVFIRINFPINSYQKLSKNA